MYILFVLLNETIFNHHKGNILSNPVCSLYPHLLCAHNHASQSLSADNRRGGARFQCNELHPTKSFPFPFPGQPCCTQCHRSQIVQCSLYPTSGTQRSPCCLDLSVATSEARAAFSDLSVATSAVSVETLALRASNSSSNSSFRRISALTVGIFWMN